MALQRNILPGPASARGGTERGIHAASTFERKDVFGFSANLREQAMLKGLKPALHLPLAFDVGRALNL